MPENLIDTNTVLSTFKEIAFNGENVPETVRLQYSRMCKDKKKSIGQFRPWAWWVEITRGCNLRCGFCATRLFPVGEYHYMTETTWRQTLDIIKKVNPIIRLEIGNAGEPTLNPRLLDFLSIARQECPEAQLLIFTNGTTLIDGRVTYADLFNAGLNMIFVDMYSPREKHIALAEASGYYFEEQNAKPKKSINVFQYQADPNIHAILLAEHPGNWPRKKVSRGAFSTFFNNLDWPAAKQYHLYPVITPSQRRCDLPSKFVNVYWDGAYAFCCFDFMREIAGKLGNVSEGTDGFFSFWFGKYMQDVRRRLRMKDRQSHPMCSRCSFRSIRCDIPYWPEKFLDYYWTETEWKKLPVQKNRKQPSADPLNRFF